MQIISNTTKMEAGIAVCTDKEARDHCVVIVKGTFETDLRGEMKLSEEQRPIVYADKHYGEPDKTCICYESEFALEKPFTDVLVVGEARAPKGKPVTELLVRLEVQGKSKDIFVIGDRHWLGSLLGVTPSDPAPFTRMPLVFDRAFGGQDDSRGEGKTAAELRNLTGVGFNPFRPKKEIVGTLLPNLERLRQRISSCRDKLEPIGYGSVGRGWKPRIDYAGTYDRKWLDETAPFLPSNFDSRYYQSAPSDQQFPIFRGGETIRCFNMADSIVAYVIPTQKIPIRFQFINQTIEKMGILDTVTLEPHLNLAMLCWRASVPLGKKLTTLQSIEIGEKPIRIHDGGRKGTFRGKPWFNGMDATIRWLRQVRGKSL
jgi:hypothetical protein